jgi:hypothetical protein
LTGATGRFFGDDLIDAVTKLRVQKAKNSVTAPMLPWSLLNRRDLIEEQGSAWFTLLHLTKPDQI